MSIEFEEEQILKAREIIARIHKCNTEPGSDCEITELKLLTDEMSSIYISYLCKSNADQTTERFYIEVTKDAKEIILNYEENVDKDDLQRMFSTLKPVQI
jgi:hypothetical protein